MCVTDYTEIGGDEEVPLGEEFQEHLRRFLRPHEKKMGKRLELVKKLVTQLSCVQYDLLVSVVLDTCMSLVNSTHFVTSCTLLYIFMSNTLLK